MVSIFASAPHNDDNVAIVVVAEVWRLMDALVEDVPETAVDELRCSFEIEIAA